jgi:hypothetical protein
MISSPEFYHLDRGGRRARQTTECGVRQGFTSGRGPTDDGCGFVFDISADSKFLLSANFPTGLYALSLADKKCTLLLPGHASAYDHFSSDGKLPFAFRHSYLGNAYDSSKDLSTVVYTRPGSHADLYLLK